MHNSSDLEIKRCSWVTKDLVYIAYHDTEWGKPIYDNIRLFEMLCLEGQQAGLSWLTILKKRENYRNLFFNFDPLKISKINCDDIRNLLTKTDIVRHKGKIESIVNNAQCYIKMLNNKEDFSEFVWNFVENKPIINNWKCNEEVPSKTTLSTALSKALKSRGFKYVGSTICYSFMQACGLVNDHVKQCQFKK